MTDGDYEERLVARALARLQGAGEDYSEAQVRAGVAQLLAFARLSRSAESPDRVALFEIFAPYVVRGATTWLEIFVSLDDDDRVAAEAILAGRRMAEVLAFDDEDYDTLDTD